MILTRTPIYEKLRKRSYRRWIRGARTWREHDAYLEGVRDALREVGIE